MSSDDILIIGAVGLLGFAAYKYFNAPAAAQPSIPYSPIPAPLASDTQPVDLTLPPITDAQLNITPQPINVADLFGMMTPSTGGHPGAQSVSSNGIAFIENEESFRPSPYKDGAHYAIGFGHQIEPGEAFPAAITEAQAYQMLLNDLQPITDAINQSVSAVLTQNMFDALASFTYNVGIGAFQGSTLLRTLNLPDYAGAAAQFAVWANPARRAREAKLFLG